MLTRQHGMTIRDVILMPGNFDLWGHLVSHTPKVELTRPRNVGHLSDTLCLTVYGISAGSKSAPSIHGELPALSEVALPGEGTAIAAY